jgi:hypothetical protein
LWAPTFHLVARGGLVHIFGQELVKTKLCGRSHKNTR